jgi:5,5'-dehydrodivanillate O-demethylase
MASRYEDFMSIGPDTLAGRFVRTFWQPVYQSDQLPKGKPAALHTLGEDFTLFRSDSGTVHLVGPRCAHRGLKLSTGRVEGENIRCFYHGWCYDGSGQCVDQPAEKESFAERVQIPSYPVREYIGLIFAYLGEGEPPEFPTFDAFDQDDGFVDLRSNFRPWPFFTQIENSIDESHFNFAHRRSKFADIGMTNEIPELLFEETDYGFVRMGKRGNAVRTSHVIMPNLGLSPIYEHDMGWAEHLAWRVPVNDGTHISVLADFVHKTGAEADKFREIRAKKRAALKKMEPALSVVERIINGEMHADDVDIDRPDIIFIQDAVSCMGQGLDRDRENDLLGTSDKHVSVMRRLWTREMRAIDKGRPMKKWRIPSDLPVTKGTGDEAA